MITELEIPVYLSKELLYRLVDNAEAKVRNDAIKLLFIMYAGGISIPEHLSYLEEKVREVLEKTGNSLSDSICLINKEITAAGLFVKNVIDVAREGNKWLNFC